ncbi:hypothetical protein BH11MYX2_BH11MYX2_13940 [soil metagenome]
MSAFRRRLHFATPLVLVLGCGGSQTPETPQPEVPGHKWRVYGSGDNCSASEPMTGCPKGAMCNPPPPSNVDCPPGMTDGQSVQILERDDKTCAIIPPGCTELSCVTQATPCPDPFGTPRKLKGSVWQITRADDACFARTDACPPEDQTCAQVMECPASPDATRIAMLRGVCVIAPAGCADDSCIGATTDCPLPAGKDLGALKWLGKRSGSQCTVTSRGPIEGERTDTIACPPDPKSSPTFQIDRPTRAGECNYRAGSAPAVIVPCPPSTPPVSH